MNRSRSSRAPRTASIMRLLIAVSDLWMPGVSMNITCASLRRQNALYGGARVGLSATMDSFCPTSAFNNADLPA